MPEADEAALADVVRHLHAIAAGPEAWSAAFEKVGRALKAERVSFLISDRTGSVAQESWPLAPEGEIEYARDYARRDLRAARVWGGRRGVMSTADLMTPEEIARCPVHQEYYRRWPECWHTLIAPTDVDGGLVVPTLQRGARVGDFEPAARRALALLVPHMVAASRARRLVGGVVSLVDLPAALDALPEAMFLLDIIGRVRFANRRGQALAAAREGLAVHAGMLHVLHPRSRRSFDRMIAAALSAARGSPASESLSTVIRRSESKALLVEALPVSGMSQAAVVVRVRDPLRLDEPSVEMIREALGLTDAEARLALTIARGGSLSEHAASAGISVTTARTHMRNLREKIGAKRQADVVRMVLRLSGSV